MITRISLARYFAEWLYGGVFFAEKLEEYGEPQHAKRLYKALDALTEVFAVEVGREDLADVMRAVTAYLDAYPLGSAPDVNGSAD